MGLQGDIDLNFWLTRGLARKLGVSLNEAMHSGFLTQEDFAQMITRCRTCSATEQCMAYLSEFKGQDAAPPAYCRNAEVLGELAELMRKH